MIEKNSVICFIGDSITEGVGADKRYIEYIAEKTECITHGFGVNGAKTVDLHAQLDMLDSTVGDRFDILFMLIGTNDFNCGIPLGEFFTEHTESIPCNSDELGQPTAYSMRKKREFIFDDSTFCGRLNRVLERIKHKYADKRVIMLTPPHRAYAYFGGTNIQPNELYANSIGEYFDEYVSVLRKAADIWSVELIDIYRDSGLFPLEYENAKQYFSNSETDRLHPSSNGHKRIAETVLNKA